MRSAVTPGMEDEAFQRASQAVVPMTKEEVRVLALSRLRLHRHAVLYAIRGGMEQHRRLYEQALADLTQAIEMEPENADFYVSRATLYLEMKKRKLARHDTQMAIKYGADPIEMASLLK